MKQLIVVAALVIAILVGFRMWRGRVDRTKPDAVAAAFFTALKGKDLSTAASYYVPEGAAAWQADAKSKIDQMQSGSYTRFFEELPSSGTFTGSHNAKSPANEQTMTNGAGVVEMRQVDGKWYVCKAPL